MKPLSTYVTTAVIVLFVQTDSAQGHTDVQFSYVDGKINIGTAPGSQSLVFESNFPTFGIERQFATLPGFASEAINGLGIGPGDQIFYDVLDDLLFWDGTSLTTPPQNHSILIENVGVGVPDTIIAGDSGQQLGGETPPRNRIGAAGGDGDFHVDLRWRLEPNPSPAAFGVYGVKLRLTTSAAGITHSDPAIFAFNYGLSNTGFEQAIAAFDSLLAPGVDGDFNDDGDADGDDFLIWQRGSPPDPTGLSDWLSSYGTPNQSSQQFVASIPEPEAIVLCLTVMALIASSIPRAHNLFH